ncbi:MAG: efflux RND transporter periplasmic adaptor subunit [Gammaproteobacteria bacterium]|nr:efflux RND transporter periplasmic adaptor subunit [Gammaproteobacteria bacterium]NNM01129.1 efflux RND transporter periplasmic adaptor subunit [Gammaproteobacteria bacterium]
MMKAMDIAARDRAAAHAAWPQPLRGAALLSVFCALSALMARPAAAVDLPALDCVITPSAIADVSSSAQGRIEAILVERSDRVTKGQPIAELDAGVELANVAIAEKRSTMIAEMRLSDVNLKYDGRRKQRFESLHTRKVASTQDLDEVERAADLAVWERQQARDSYRLRQLELIRAQEVLERRTVRSSIDGVVVQRLKSEGEYVEDQPILRVARLDPLHVETIVPMEMFGRIHVGMEADVVPESVDSGPFRAVVRVVDRVGDAAAGTFGVQLEMPNGDSKLPAGLKCQVQFLKTTQAGRTAPAAAPETAVDARPAGSDITS